MSKVIGICKKESCEYCEYKERQEVDDNNPICAGCGEPLELIDEKEKKGEDGGTNSKNWKRILKRILLILATILVLGGIVFGIMTLVKSCGGRSDTPGTASLSISIDEATGRLIATILPTDLPEKDKKVTWESSDKLVATVDSNGVVTAVAKGNTVISAHTDNGLSATCYVTVGEVIDAIDVTGVTLDKITLSLKKNELEQLTVTVSPEDATNKEVHWSSDNPSVAVVDSTGLVLSVAKGTAHISVTANGEKTAICTVMVNDDNDNGNSNDSSNDSYRGTVSVSGGSYTGELKNGKPHGMGTVRYNSRTLIDSRDPKKRYAEAGDYLVGEFYEGRLVQGKLNNKETIIIGRGVY